MERATRTATTLAMTVPRKGPCSGRDRYRGGRPSSPALVARWQTRNGGGRRRVARPPNFASCDGWSGCDPTAGGGSNGRDAADVADGGDAAVVDAVVVGGGAVAAVGGTRPRRPDSATTWKRSWRSVGPTRFPNRKLILRHTFPSVVASFSANGKENGASNQCRQTSEWYAGHKMGTKWHGKRNETWEQVVFFSKITWQEWRRRVSTAVRATNWTRPVRYY